MHRRTIIFAAMAAGFAGWAPKAAVGQAAVGQAHVGQAAAGQTGPAIESKTAEQVFKNITQLKGMPA
ncbi:MAG TPA: hypothetical protein VKJ01_05605, partial [Candidatus Solibacter sp.]|nr:hypothetical protein [Candidatus Solibacter sp.]